MDAFELLKKDHEKVSDLFSKIESASGQAKLGLFTQLKGELDLHAHIEETVLYPALENTEEAREITLEAYEEHNVVKDLLAQLSSEATPDDEWDAKLKVLKENVEHHVEEEEGEMFGKARQALGQPKIEELGLELEAEKNRASGGEQKSATAEPQVEAVEAKEPENESPGVLQRLAKLVGLGSEPSTRSTGGSKKRTTAGTTSKSASKTRVAAKKTAQKKTAAKKAAPRKTVAKKASPRKTAAKKTVARKASASARSGKAASKAAARKATKSRSAKKATKATRAGASKRSSGSRGAAAKSAPRAASNQRLKPTRSKQTGKSTKSKARSR